MTSSPRAAAANSRAALLVGRAREARRELLDQAQQPHRHRRRLAVAVLHAGRHERELAQQLVVVLLRGGPDLHRQLQQPHRVQLRVGALMPRPPVRPAPDVRAAAGRRPRGRRGRSCPSSSSSSSACRERVLERQQRPHRLAVDRSASTPHDDDRLSTMRRPAAGRGRAAVLPGVQPAGQRRRWPRPARTRRRRAAAGRSRCARAACSSWRARRRPAPRSRR